MARTRFRTQLAFLIAAWALMGAKAAPKGQNVCSNLHFTRPVDPGFSDQEKRLACGKGSGQKGIYPEWQVIPDAQRKYSVRVFLQSRGYLNPSFELRGKQLWVDPGTKRKVSGLAVVGAPKDFDYSRKRHVIGEALTPDLLDRLKSWTIERLRGLGYACPEVELRGDPDTGRITSEIRAGDRTRLASIHEKQLIPGLMPGIFRRYDAFELGNWFNGDFLNLTQQRVMAEGQVESLKLFVDHCEDGKAYVDQDVMAGKPRLLTLGAGVNTEGYILARGEWKDVRLGNTASLIDFSLQVDGYEQTFAAYADWYLLDHPSRFYLRPSFTTDHEHQTPYETLTVRNALSAQTTMDTQSLGYQFGLGPDYEYVNNIRGAGAASSRFLLLEPTFRVASHYFDFFQTSPRAGFLVALTGDLGGHSLGSYANVQQLSIHSEALWNLFQYSPPLVIFGLRGTVASTWVGSYNAITAAIPPPFRDYLGGSTDLRGFGLLELPEDQIGRLTSAYGGFETRFLNLLPYGLQPFAFIDVGALGAEAAELDTPIYWSPGIGMRLETPIGNFRATLAHGYLTGNPDPSASHFQAFFSFGEEF